MPVEQKRLLITSLSALRASEPISISDTNLAVGLTVLCFASRVWAIPASLWEWDDIQFARALHIFDVASHSPHPPGYPVFVMLSRAAYFLLRDEHLALVSVNLVAASFLGAALFYLFRELFADRAVALAGAIIGIFVPNVWIYSAAPRSDSAALALGVMALTLVLRGRHSHRALYVGCALLGLGCGLRVTLLPVVAPTLAVVLLMRLRRGEWRLAALSLAIIAFCVSLWYVPLVIDTTWHVYRAVMAAQSEFIKTHDTIYNDPLPYRLRRFFVAPWGASWIMWSMYLLSAFGVLSLGVRRCWRTLGWTLLAFIPYLIFTILLNTPLGALFYSLPYMPLFAGLAACGLIMPLRFVSSYFTSFPWSRRAAEGTGLALTTVLTLGMASWSYPVIRMLRSEGSPPLRAMRYIKEVADPTSAVIYFDGVFSPHVWFYLSDYRTEARREGAATWVNLISPPINASRFFNLTTEPEAGGESREFKWTAGRGRERLRVVSTKRYFDVYVGESRDDRRLRFLDGWHLREQDGEQSWHWMTGRGRVAFLVNSNVMSLRLRGALPAAVARDGLPTFTLRIDGREVERFVPNSTVIDHTLTFATDARHLWSTLTIETGETMIPSRLGASTDTRELGFQCFSLHFTPAKGQAPAAFPPNRFIGKGWHELENDRSRSFRWTEAEAVVHLPPIDGEALMEVVMEVPSAEGGARSPVTLTIGDVLLDSFQPPPGIFTKTYRVPASLRRPAETDLKISAVARIFPNDPRALAVKVFHLGWVPTGEG